MDWNPSFFEQLGKSRMVKRAVKAEAKKVAAKARASAPVESGKYARSIKVKMVDHSDRTVAYVVADVDYGMAVEAHTGNLARALGGSGGSQTVWYTTKAGKRIRATQAQVANWTRGSRG